MFLSLSQLAHLLKKIPCHLLVCISHCCVYNGSSVNVIDTVNVNSKNFVITLLWGMVNVHFRNLCQISFLLSNLFL